MNNNKSNVPFAAIITGLSLVVLAMGYFLFKTSPQNSSQSVGAVDNMHGGASVSVNSNALNSLVGKALPSIQLSDKDGKTYTADDFKGKDTVLFFSEGLMCYPACWNQMASFGSDQRFNSAQIQAISVVTDSVKEWQTAIAKMPQLAKATTMFDANANVSRQLGMLTLQSSMHRGSLPGHTYVVLDKDGIVRYVFDDPNMAIANDSLFNKIQELNKQ